MANQAFFHEAMATTYSLKFPELESSEAQDIAEQCFHVLDALESKLSRFIPDSDVYRINNMHANSSMLLEEEVHECLKAAIEISGHTDGHFDIGTAELSDIYRGLQAGLLNEFEYDQAIQTALAEKAEGSLYVSPDEPMVHCFTPGIKIDLGGIGKGYALDFLARICRDRGITTFCLDAGGSTVLVETDLDDGWDYHLAASKDRRQVRIANGSVSASGSKHQGNHIFNPITGQNDERIYDRLWVSATNALQSDACATAFYNMEVLEIEQVMQQIKSIHWVAYAQRGEIKFIERKGIQESISTGAGVSSTS